MTDMEKMNAPIPEKEHFYNKLTESYPDDEQYTHLLYQCDLFKLRTMRDLTKFYCCLDTILLAGNSKIGLGKMAYYIFRILQ